MDCSGALSFVWCAVRALLGLDRELTDLTRHCSGCSVISSLGEKGPTVQGGMLGMWQASSVEVNLEML